MSETASFQFSRRRTIGMLAASAVAIPAVARTAALKTGNVGAIAFDGFPIFDPRSVGAQVKAMVPEKGEALAQAWSTKLFGYTWLYTTAGQYAPFDVIADQSLKYAADALGLALSNDVRSKLVAAYSQLDVWPDVKPALEKLKAAGVRLAFLSNLGEATLRANLDRTGITSTFDHVLSTDRVRQFKPAPSAYAMAINAFGLPKEQIGFAAFGGWDAAGAAWFGYRTAWINRLGVPRERLEPGPAIVAPGMDGVLALAGLA